MAWIKEALTGSIVSTVTASIIYLWNKRKTFLRHTNRFFKFSEEIDLLIANDKKHDIEISILKSKQMSGFYTIPDPIFITNTKGELIFANPAWLKIMQLQLDDAKGFGFLKVVHPENKIQVQEYSREQKDSPSSFEGVIVFRPYISKTKLTTICRSEPVHDCTGSVIETVGRLTVISNVAE